MTADAGRPVPVHASGGGVVKNCIMCGLPYDWHDRAPKNWLACPDRDAIVKIEKRLEDELALVAAALRAREEDRG